MLVVTGQISGRAMALPFEKHTGAGVNPV